LGHLKAKRISLGALWEIGKENLENKNTQGGKTKVALTIK